MTLKAIHVGAGSFQNLVETDRNLLDYLGQRVPGVIFTSGNSLTSIPDLRVSPGTGHTANVVKGAAILRESVNPIVRGAYFAYADTDEVVTLPVPQANPFFVAVVLRVLDAQYSGGGLVGGPGTVLEVVSGTPNASPVVVTDAAISGVAGKFGAWIRLADIRINTADSGAIPSGQFTDRRTPGGFGGDINCLSTLRPVMTLGFRGAHAFELDTGNDIYWDGTTWQSPNTAPWAIAGGTGTSLPANVDYGIGTVSVTEGSAVCSGGLDSIVFNRNGLVTVHARFYMPSSGARTVWIGVPTATKSAMAAVPSGLGAEVDRVSLSWTSRITSGDVINFGQRCTGAVNTTCTINAMFFPTYK